MRSIWEARVHVSGGSAVLDKVANTSKEGPARDVDISNDVEWQTIVADDEGAEAEVGRQLEKVCPLFISALLSYSLWALHTHTCDEIDEEDIHALALPWYL